MTNLFLRRRVIGISTVALGAFAGCLDEHHRNLSFRLYDVSETNGEYTVSMSAHVSVVGEWESFRDVTVVGKAKDGTIVCRKELGDITQGGEQERVTFRCGGFPYTLTYEIAGDPCAPDTTITKMVYVPEENDWTPRGIEC